MALSSMLNFASRATTFPSAVKINGLISASEPSIASFAFASAIMQAAAAFTLAAGTPMPNASFRACHAARPKPGSMVSFRIFSGVCAATSSISIPPSEDAMNTVFPMARSSTMPTYNSFAMGSSSSTRTRCTSRPSGPVWWVISVMPRIFLATSAASVESLATFTPPPLPRPPAWIWAFTTTPPPNFLAAASASSAVKTTSPLGTGTPYLASIALAWYSWIFIGYCGLRRVC